jgi:alanyl-tRNA synthetase
VRYGYQTLGLKEPFLADLSVVLGQIMGGSFQELTNQKDIIEKVIREEELSFFRTLEQGLKRIDNLIEQAKSSGSAQLTGSAVFELYDTFGFPFDLTDLIARENNISVDEVGFNEELTKQKDRSRAATAIETDDWVQVHPDTATKFIGYDEQTAPIELIKYRKVTQKQKTFYQLVFNQTPFYPEGGGQVGDTGFIVNEAESIAIFDTKKENNLIIHLAEKLPEHPASSFEAKINSKNRALSACNHSATHLLHKALRTVLGTHVEQKGSLVNANYLRFDFSHFSKVTDEEMAQIEAMVVAEIKANLPLNEKRDYPIEDAKAMGAMALFGEKYGDAVRVVQFGDSVELCGGTHVQQTGEIGLFKIQSEGAVAAGIRRIEAITNAAVEDYFNEQEKQLKAVNELLRNPKDITKAVDDLLTKNNALQKQVESLKKAQAKVIKSELKSTIENKGDYSLLTAAVELDAASVKDILFQLKGEVAHLVAIIGSTEDDKCAVSVFVDDALVGTKNWNAGNIVKAVAAHIQGGGGGQAFFATAGGKNPAGIPTAIAAAKAMLDA